MVMIRVVVWRIAFASRVSGKCFLDSLADVFHGKSARTFDQKDILWNKTGHQIVDQVRLLHKGLARAG